MLTIKFKGLTFKLPNEDKLFKFKIHRFVDEVHDVLKMLDLRENGIFFEIGLCFGVTSITALKTGRFKEAHGMEAHRLNCKLSEVNKKINSVPLHIHNYGASDSAGVGHIASAPRDNIGGHIVTHEPGTGDKVELITIDELLEKKNIDPKEITLVWCDAQGSEGKLLKGAKKILESKVHWVMEIAPDLLTKNGTSLDELMQLVTPCFKKVADLKENNPAVKDIGHLRNIYEKYKSIRKFVSEGVTKSSHTNVLLYPE